MTRGKNFLVLFLLFSLSFLFLPQAVDSKGGYFQIETITNDGFGRGDDIMDFNDALQFGSYLYITTDSWMLDPSPGLVFRSQSGNSDDWALAAIAGFGDNDNIALDAMVNFDNNLYITTSNTNGAEIWRSADGSNWTAVIGGGAATDNGFGDANNVIVRETIEFESDLWAFTDNAVDGVEIWRSANGTDWVQLTDDPINPGFELPDFDDATDAYVQRAFSYNSRLFIYCLDNNDVEAYADDVELWYTEGGDTPVWTEVGGTFLDVIGDSSDLWFKQHSGTLYVGNDNSPGKIYSSENGTDYDLIGTFIDSSYVFPASTTKGLLVAVGYIGGANDQLDLYRYSGGSFINTGVSFSDMGYFVLDAVQFGDYYYAWGGWDGVLMRVDLRPTTNTSSSSQSQLGDGVVEVTFTAGDITDADNLRAKIEYNIGSGYESATLSEDAKDISATYGIVAVDNDNEYQVGNASGWITTSSGANTISVKWLSKEDEPQSDTTNADIRVTVYDGSTTGEAKEEGSVTVDNVNPSITELNLTEGQSISTNPFVIKAKAADASSGMWKVEFSIDGNLICTDTVADSDGFYSCSWDTETYHSAVDVQAYDAAGNTSVQSVNAYVGLPETGEDILHMQVLGLALIVTSLVMIRKRSKYSAY